MANPYDLRVIGFFLEHPQAHAALVEIAEEYNEQIIMHICEPNSPPEMRELLEINDVMVGHIISHEPIAVIKPNGDVERIDKSPTGIERKELIEELGVEEVDAAINYLTHNSVWRVQLNKRFGQLNKVYYTETTEDATDLNVRYDANNGLPTGIMVLSVRKATLDDLREFMHSGD